MMPASHARNYLYQLTGMGWCYGEGEQATYQYRWHKCGPSSHRVTIEDLHSYDKPAMAVTGVHGDMPECQRNPIAPQDSGRCKKEAADSRAESSPSLDYSFIKTLPCRTYIAVMYTPLAEYLATPIYGHWSRYGGDNSPSTCEATGYVEATCKAHVSFNMTKPKAGENTTAEPVLITPLQTTAPKPALAIPTPTRLRTH
jgi:hypothetical protein